MAIKNGIAQLGFAQIIKRQTYLFQTLQNNICYEVAAGVETVFGTSITPNF